MWANQPATGHPNKASLGEQKGSDTMTDREEQMKQRAYLAAQRIATAWGRELRLMEQEGYDEDERDSILEEADTRPISWVIPPDEPEAEG
jgi:hypothetical protein